MQLVFLLDAAQDRDGVLNRRLAHEHRLEPPRQRRVLLDMLAVLVERGGADAVQRAARQFRLDQVRSIHRAFGAAGAHQVVQLVDEQDDLSLGRLHLLEHGLQPLLELAAIFRPGDQCAEIERQQLLALQCLGHVAIDDAQREAVDDGGLADARLADQHRIVLGTARQHLDGAADFLIAPDDRVEFSLARQRCYVAGVFLQRVEVRLGIRAVDRAALADVVDRLLQRLGSRAGVAQRTGSGRVGGSDCHQQPVLRDELVAGLGRGLLRGIQDAHEVRRDLRLAGAGALHLWQPLQFGPDRGERRLRVAACGLDQAGGRAFLVVQQRLQQVLRRDLLVKLAYCDGLGGLQEATRPLGEFLNVHLYVPVTRRPVTAHP